MTKKKREREALPERGQRGRRKVGREEMESCWMDDRERERDEEGRRRRRGRERVRQQRGRERERDDGS